MARTSETGHAKNVANLDNLISFVLVVFFLVVISSCGNEEFNLPPIINEQLFEIHENSPNGTLIDTIKAVDPDQDQELIFKIISGNFDSAFKLDSMSGELSVNDSSFLDYEKKKKFELSVQVTDNSDNPVSTTNLVTVNLLDIAPIQEGLVSYYTFENSADDLIGLNDGIENSVEYYTDFTNPQNKTIGFNGVSSFVNLRSNFDFPQMTINLWFLAKEFDSGFDLIYTSDNPSRQYGLTSIAIRKDNGINNLYFNVSGQNITVEIETDKWYNVTIVRDNKEFEYYLNNELVFSGVFLNYLTSPDGSESAIIGANRTLLRGFLKGNLDNLRIYDRALSKEEVLVLFNE